MVRIIFILAFLAAVRTSAAEDAQVPMASESDSDTYYKFEWPIHRIAIIGAGPGYGRIAIRTYFSHSFRLSVGLLLIGSSPRQATMFIYLNVTILQAETGITPTRPLVVALSLMQTLL